MNRFVISLAAVAGLAIATPALADPITLDSSNIGSSFTLDFNGFVDSGPSIDGLTSSISFTLTGASANQYSFDYSVANTTDSGLTSRLSSFAFNVNPDISGATATGAYQYTIIDGKYPNGIGSVDVCFKAGDTNSCQGNPGGVTEGLTGTGTLTLDFAGDVDNITLSEFFVRYQSITGAGHVTSASGRSTTSTSTSSTSGGTPVPAPGMLGLLALALVSLGFMRRRRISDDEALRPAFA